MKTTQSFLSLRTCPLTRLLAVTTALALTLSAGKTLAKKPGTGTTTPVIITLLDQSGDAIQSDGLGPYSSGHGVISVIQSDGTLDLNLAQTKKRTVLLDCSGITKVDSTCDPTPGTNDVPDFCYPLTGNPLAALVQYPNLFTQNLDLLSMAPGDIDYGGFAVNFGNGCGAPNNVPWRIRFKQSDTDHDVYYSLDFNGCSASVTVQAYDNDPRLGVPGTGVDTWFITATLDPTSGTGAEACLWSGGTGEAAPAELVEMPFSLMVQLQ